MIALSLFDALEDSEHFPNELDLQLVEHLWINGAEALSFLRDNLMLAEQQHAAPELIRALRRCLWRYRVRELKQAVLEVIRTADAGAVAGLLRDHLPGAQRHPR